jgi:hypothetical protein
MNAAAPAFLTSVTTPSLTSPAATNLTLGTTDSGAAITVLSASNNVGIGTTTPSDNLVVSNAGGAGLEIGVGTGSVINQAYKRSAPTGYVDYQDTCLNRIFVINGSTEAMRIASTGTVSIASTTAGSANAGALVLQGGISAGNTGSAASYFGGAVTAASFYTGTGNSGAAEFKNSVSGSPQTMGLFNTSTAASSDVAYGFQTQGSRTCNWLLSRSTGLLEFTDGYQTRGNVRASFDMNTGDATFAGAVSITGNVGFYGQAATAKPTGVAVTAAAIHAALLTLNLIAA